MKVLVVLNGSVNVRYPEIGRLYTMSKAAIQFDI